MAHADRPVILVRVVHAAAPHALEIESLHLPEGATLRDAVQASALLRRGLAAAGPGRHIGLWGRLCGPDQVLQDQDRLELLRPLQMDPMEARRHRLQREGLTPARRAPRRQHRP